VTDVSERTVHIVDDDPSARSGLTRLVRAMGWHAESFASAAKFLAAGRRDGPGCIVLDVRMPGMTGPELQEELCKSDYCMPIIFLSAHGDVPTTARTMKRGAVDFLTKPVDRADLQSAIRAALALDAETRAELAVRGSTIEHFCRLTPREHEVMRYVISGLLNKQIAGELGIAEDTVKLHRGRVMHKLGLDSLAELVRLCEHAGVAPAEASQ
jgi:FixJ family two-component response regulator